MTPNRPDHHGDGPDPVGEMGHADPALAVRIYRQAMRRDEDERGRLQALVEGVEF